MIRVKICGLADIEHITVAAEAGADFAGFVFAESRRYVSPEVILPLVRTIRDRKQRPSIVGVFANAPIDTVNSIVEYCHLDSVQLSGNETWQYCLQIKRPVIKVLHITQSTTTDQVLAEIENGNRSLKNKGLAFLLDSKSDTQFGGTGIAFDWKVAKEVAAFFPVIIAGGLNPENVKTLITKTTPWGVDVSSGVETEGLKDSEKIRSFIKAVRQAEGADK
jgi:phosphoribosylanthranilate isomerase